MNRKYIPLALILLFSVNQVHSQTGPGGVGNSSTMETWLEASKLTGLSNSSQLSSWLDISGNNNHAVQVTSGNQPTYLTNQINGLPAIDFDGVDDYLDFSSHITTGANSTFIVFKESGARNLQTILSIEKHILYAKDASYNAAYGTLSSASSLTIRRSPGYSIFSGQTDASVGSSDFLLTSAEGSVTRTRTGFLTQPRSSIGIRTTGDVLPMFGQVPELIIFNEQLNSAKRKIVGNYLAAKYNLTAEQNLYAHKSTHGRDVIGIGQEADGNHVESRGLDSLLINNPSALGNGDYLLIGNDGGGFNTSTDVPINLLNRWNKVWRANVTGTPGTVDMTFYLGLNDFAGDPNNYVVLVENADGNFANGGTSLHEGGRTYDAINKTISFTGVVLGDGNYFTLAVKIPEVSLPNIDYGPGGVGTTSNIEAWLDASKLTGLNNSELLYSWLDFSGNNNHAEQILAGNRPTYLTNQVNGLPAIDFDGVDDYLDFSSHITTGANSTFIVFKESGARNLQTILSIEKHILYAKDASYNAAYGTLSSASSLTIRRSPGYSIFSGQTDASVGSSDFLLTSAEGSVTRTRTGFLTQPRSSIGIRTTGDVLPMFGQVPELIIFNEQLNSAKRKIVGNYLAAKYNLTAEQNLYAHKSTHGRDVIGIGQEADGNHLESRGVDSLLINNPSALGNGDYLLIGNDGADFSTSTDVGVLTTQRWNKIWRADVTGTPGTIDLVFYLGNNDFAVDPNNYAVLIENVDGDFGNGGTSVQETGSLYNALTKTLTFTGITLNDGDYFTIAEKGPITAIATGNWEATSTWSCDCVPTASSTVIIPSPFTVSINELANAKSVTINSGGALTIVSNDTLQIVDSLTIEGTFNSGAEGTILANGTTNQTFANSSGTNVELVNLISNNPTNLFLTGGWSLNNTLQVNVGTLDVSGADSLVLLSNSTKTAEILESNGSFVGDFTLQRFISARNANYSNIAAPISNATVASIDDDVAISGVGGRFGNVSANPGGGIFYSMFEYDRSDNNKLDSIQSTAAALAPGVGYELYLFTTLGSFAETTLDYVGTPNFGNITPPSILSGFNLVGNPYFCHLDRAQLDNSNISPTIYIFNSSTGAYTTLGANKIAPGQGFWVNNTSGVTVPFNFDEGDKAADGSSIFLRKKGSKEFSLELSNDVNYFKNKISMSFDYSATEGMDQFDARFLPSPMNNASELYFTTITKDKLMKNTLNQLEESHVVPLELKIGEVGTYTINSANISSILDNYSCVYLSDEATKESIDLSVENDYTFEAESGVSERFKLVVSNSFEACEKALNAADLNQKIDDRLKLRESYGNWFLDYNLGEELETVLVSVYGMNGQQVLSKIELNLSENGTHKLEELNNLNGIFIIQIVGSKNVLNQTIKL